MIDENSKKIANYLRAAFAGTPSVQRYLAMDNVRYVDIIKTPHTDHVTYLGTIGGFKRKMNGAPAGAETIRVELISAVNERCTEIMAQTLSFLILCLDTDKVFYHPGMVVDDAIPKNDLTIMRDVYLCNPFLWDDGLKSLQIEDYDVAFLYVLPITQQEKAFYDAHGAAEFEKRLYENHIEYFDLNRID